MAFIYAIRNRSGLRWSLKALVLGLTSVLAFTETLYAQPAKHVVVITIDGFRPDFYREASWGAVNMQQMAKQGVSADGVNSIFPSLTFPNHTSIITGVRSARHGIYHNSPVSMDGSSVEWYWYEKDIRVKTLWDAVREEGGVTASVNWPVSVGDAVDYNIPIIKKKGLTQLAATAQYSVPPGLMEEVQRYATGDLDSVSYNTNEDLLVIDQNVARITGYLIRKYKPTLTTVRLSAVDHFEHLDGREGDLVARAVSGADNAIGHIIECIHRAGIADSSVVIVTGDHGFVDVHTSFSPNFLLKQAGLFNDQKGKWKAQFKPAGGSSFLYLKDPEDKRTLKRVVELLSALPEFKAKKFEIVSRRQLDETGSDPRAALALNGTKGYSFVGTARAPFVKSVNRGTHGYLPDFREIRTGFVAFGAGLKKDFSIPLMEIIDIAPLVTELLDLDMDNMEGKLHNGMLGSTTPDREQ